MNIPGSVTGKGINYDTGFRPGGRDSRPGFDLTQVKNEIRVIAAELRCTAVRITGADPERIAAAGEFAAAAGLEVWFVPFPCELHGKPVAVTEFGCCTYQGAVDRGGLGWAISDQQAVPATLDGDYLRDEGEQVRYLHELLEIFESEGVHNAFWFTFACPIATTLAPTLTWPPMARSRCWTRMGRHGDARKSSTRWPPRADDRPACR